MNARTVVSGLLLLASSSAAVAAAPACAPTVEKGWIRAAPPGATMLAGYAELHNPCKVPFEVVGVKGRDFVMAMVHETKVENGISTMRPAKFSPVPAHGVLRFEPGGRHIMLMHPRRALPPGTVVRIELLMADGKRIPVDLTVRRDPPR